jgi:hypothetical protein
MPRGSGVDFERPRHRPPSHVQYGFCALPRAPQYIYACRLRQLAVFLLQVGLRSKPSYFRCFWSVDMRSSNFSMLLPSAASKSSRRTAHVHLAVLLRCARKKERDDRCRTATHLLTLVRIGANNCSIMVSHTCESDRLVLIGHHCHPRRRQRPLWSIPQSGCQRPELAGPRRSPATARAVIAQRSTSAHIQPVPAGEPEGVLVPAPLTGSHSAGRVTNSETRPQPPPELINELSFSAVTEPPMVR